MLNQIDLSRADLNLLVLFDVVLEVRNVGRAAERLNLTPSAVSHGLGRLRRLLNDQLFLRTPKGVVPTARATELAAPVADILARARNVIATAEPFDPKTSARRFAIGAPDAASAVFLPSLLEGLRRQAPGIDIAVSQMLPPPGRLGERAWDGAFAVIDSRAVDIAVVPVDEIPARFAHQVLYEEEFVVAMRAGHPLARKPTLDRYCEMHHLVVSMMGDPHGFVDEALAKQGRVRRVALTVPNFMMAIALVADTDLVAAVPRHFAAAYGPRFGVVIAEAPLPLPRYRMRAVVPKVALMDVGLAWLFRMMTPEAPAPARKRGRR